MSNANGCIPIFFHANDQHGLLDVSAENCELRVIIRKSDELGGYYLDADAVDLNNDSSDGWYEFIDLVSQPDVFEIVGTPEPDCAWFVNKQWIFTELYEAVHCAKIFADALGVQAKE